MRLGRLALFFVFVALFFAVHAPVRAQTNSDRQKQLKEDIQEISAEEAAARQTLAEIRARKAVVDARVAEIDAQLADAGATVTAKEAEVARLDVALRDAQTRLAAAQSQLDTAKEEVRESAARLYRSARGGATYDYLTVQRPADLVHATKYLDHANVRQRQIMRQLAVLRDDVAVYRQAVETTKADADAAAAAAQRARDDISRARSEIEPARAEAAAQAEAESAQAAALAGKKQQAEQELEAVSAAIAEEIRRATASSGPVPSSSGNVGACDAQPTRGTVSSGFGMRGGGMHAGIDIAAPTGTPIYACWGGRVIIAGWQGGYGNTIVIDHGGGISTLYAHQSGLAASVGQTVSSGSLIGYVGSTGNSTGPHLHFEVRINGGTVNPAPYL